MTADLDANKAVTPDDTPYALVEYAEEQVDTKDPRRYTISSSKTETTQGVMLDLGKKINQVDKDIGSLNSNVGDLMSEQKWFRRIGYGVIAAAIIAGGWFFNQLNNIKDDVADIKFEFTKEINSSQMMLSKQLTESTDKILQEVKANKEQINEIKLELANNHPETK